MGLDALNIDLVQVHGDGVDASLERRLLRVGDGRSFEEGVDGAGERLGQGRHADEMSSRAHGGEDGVDAVR